MKTASHQKLSLKQVLITIYFPSLLIAISQGVYILIIPLFSLNLGASVAGVGTVFALKGIGTLISDVPSGFAISRFGEKRLILFSIALIVIAGFISSQAESIFLLGVATFVFGIGTGIWMLARLSYLAESVLLSQRGRAMSLLGGVQRVGVFIGPILGGLSIKYLGFEITLLMATMLPVFAFGLVWLILPDTGKHPESPQSQKILKQVPSIFIEHKTTFLTAGLATIALKLIRAGRQLLLPLWGIHIGLDAAEIGLVYGVSSAVDMSLFMVAGVIMDRYGRKWTGVPCLLFLSLSLILLPLSYDFASFMIIAFLAGFGNGMGSGIVMTLGADFAPPIGRSEFLGVWRLVGDVGGAVGPFITAVLGEIFVLGTASITTGGIGIMGVVIMAFFVRETMTKPRKTQ